MPVDLLTGPASEARRAAAMMELRLKIEEGSDMFYTRTDAKN